MADIALRQVRAVIAACEEGSFTRAAERENATQSGISQHVAAVERALGVKLFERSARGIVPTPAGLRYYKNCIEAVGRLEHAHEEARSLAGQISGDLRIGLMPTFTRAVLAPTLEDFVPRHSNVRLHVLEGYSAFLTDMVLADELDFAIVPAFEGRTGLKSRLLVRDREMLLSGRQRGLTPLAPVQLADCAPLKIVVPGAQNVRRRNLETYFQTHGVEIAAMLEMDAMIGTLEFVARSDWVTVLPSLICINDVGKGDLIVNPIVKPPLRAEFVIIQPARRTLSGLARRFLDCFEAQVANIHGAWERVMATPAAANDRRRQRARAHGRTSTTAARS
jgi:LysR family transcriptional regulator, nitrogen assimilation regulatory protein